MLKKVLNELRHQQGNCVSVIIPTERGFQDHKKTDAVLKKAFKQASQKLEEYGDKKVAKALVEKLENLSKDVDFSSSMDGLGLFVNEEVAELVNFPFEVEEKVIVGNSFEVRDLVFSINRMEQYYILVLSQKEARMYYGVESILQKISDRHKVSLTDEIMVEEPHGAWSYQKSRNTSNSYEDFLIHLDKLLGHQLNHRKLPVILAGIQKDISFFEHHSQHQYDIKGKVAGNFDHSPDQKLLESVQPVIEQLGWQRAQEAIEALNTAVGQNRFAAGVQSVWQAAAEGRIYKLLVEKGYTSLAYLAEDGYELFLDPQPEKKTTKLPDAVDDLIEKVMDTHGEVLFTKPGELSKFQQIAAILRF